MTPVLLEIDLTFDAFRTHLSYCLASYQTQVRFLTDSIDNPRFDLRTVEQSVPDLLTLPLLCDSSKVLLTLNFLLDVLFK